MKERRHRQELLRRAEQYLARCFRLRTPARVGELAQQLGLSREELSRKFRRSTGVTLSFYLKTQQALRAAELREQRVGGEEIARRAGCGTRRTYYRLRTRTRRRE